jgi:hypothetical protein
MEFAMTRIRLFAIVFPLFLIASCSSSGGADTTTTQAEVATTGSSTPPTCPNSHGGACLGSLDAGSYATSTFNPQITYTVPEGWANLEDLPGNFLLQKTNDLRYLGVYQNVRAPAECAEAWAEGVEGGVADLTEWYTTHPGLTTTEPEAVTIGGLDGVFIDISLEPSWNVTCPYSQGQPVVPFIIGNGTSELHHVILPGFEERLYLLEWNQGNVAIEVGSEGQPLDQYLTEVLPIIESLNFGS